MTQSSTHSQASIVPPTQGAASTQEDALLICLLDDVRTFTKIIKAITFVDEATCILSDKGLRFVVEAAKSLQAKAFLQSGLFTEFRYNSSEEHSFDLDLNIFLDCLNIFGGECTSMRMSYSGYGEPLVLLLEEGGVLTDCNIRTMVASTPTGIDIRSAEIPSNIIMKSHWLAEVFAALDQSSEDVKIHISPDQPYFRISTDGDAGITQVDCPKESDMVESFTCDCTQINRYRLTLLKPSEKALALSTKISIRMNEWGVLSMQCLINTEDGQAVFVEFLCLPCELHED
eukprot:m.62994 g.62994  ORF g.62994 m.62994 type:complete len:287 (+) comp11552_c0_seq1:189-1049(+)